MVNKNRKKNGARFPFALKLILIMSLIVSLVAALVTGFASFFFSLESQINAEENNFILNETVSVQAQNVLAGIQSSVGLLLDISQAGSGMSIERIIQDNYFLRNPDILYITVPNELSLFNAVALNMHTVTPEKITALVAANEDAISQVKQGASIVRNATAQLDFSSALFMVPYDGFGSANCVIIVFGSTSLQNLASNNGLSSIFIVNSTGQLLAHSDPELLKTDADFANNPVVADMLQSATDNKQILFTGSDGFSYYGTYRRTELGNLGVVTVTQQDAILAAVQRITRQNLLIAGIILLLSILTVYYFSKSVSQPVKKLADAAQKITDGDFEQNIPVRSRDEVGLLTGAFNNMGRALVYFSKFVNMDLVKKILKGDVALGGETREATIFFSDIRSFTAISEKLDPQEIVEFLNAYMTRMVDCIKKTDGQVDKYIGDAIMALWGVPKSAGSAKEDAFNAIRATIAMRHSLIEFNADRGGPKKPIIKIGSGINTGLVVAGLIGSDDQLSYTAIGDAVNLASRIEALNKPFGTDILISEFTYNHIKEYIIAEPMQKITVKGKEKPLQIYAVINLKGERGPQNLAEVRTLLGITPPEHSVEADEHEVKYEIIPDSKQQSAPIKGA